MNKYFYKVAMSAMVVAVLTSCRSANSQETTYVDGGDVTHLGLVFGWEPGIDDMPEGSIVYKAGEGYIYLEHSDMKTKLIFDNATVDGMGVLINTDVDIELVGNSIIKWEEGEDSLHVPKLNIYGNGALEIQSDWGIVSDEIYIDNVKLNIDTVYTGIYCGSYEQRGGEVSIVNDSEFNCLEAARMNVDSGSLDVMGDISAWALVMGETAEISAEVLWLEPEAGGTQFYDHADVNFIVVDNCFVDGTLSASIGGKLQVTDTVMRNMQKISERLGKGFYDKIYLNIEADTDLQFEDGAALDISFFDPENIEIKGKMEIISGSVIFPDNMDMSLVISV